MTVAIRPQRVGGKKKSGEGNGCWTSGMGGKGKRKGGAWSLEYTSSIT